MEGLANMLDPIFVSLSDLLLDANNPRFSELGDELNIVPENRFADEKVQANTYDKMKDQIFEVSELRDTIKTLGFLPMDRIVVRKWKGKSIDGNHKYVVIEGNRRVTALKWLIHLHGIGKESFSEEQMKNFNDLECLLLNEDIAPATAVLILPGLRHVSGIKPWGAYQKAKAVYALRKSGMNPQDSAQSLGLSTRAANASYKCFLALEQMKSDEEYGEQAEPKLYSYFEEIFKRANIRTWLCWSDEKEQFDNPERIKELYSWIIPQGEEGVSAKLPEAKSIRDLSQIISDEGSLNILRGPEGSLSRAIARYEVDHPEDWYPKIIAAISAINSLTPSIIRSMDVQTITTIQELEKCIAQLLKDRISLIPSD